MRDLSATLLTAAQKDPHVKALAKIVLTLSTTSYPYYATSGTNRILDIKHIEEPYRQTAEILLDNADGTLTSIDLKGYKGVISYGATTATGAEYSATAPLWVVGQQLLSWSDGSGRLACSLALAGTPNLLDTQGASAIYAPDSTNTDTVKTILTAIAMKTLSCYTNYHAYTITFDDEAEDFFAASLVNTFQPKDGFSIYLNESRLSAMEKLLKLTDCVMRVEDDEEIHIFRPTTTGSTYNYTYELGAGNHPFFSMSNRKRLVIPYYVQVDSHPSHGDGFTGYATDTDTATLVALDDTLDQREYKYLRLDGHTQAGNIATAILLHYQINAQKGAAIVPMNFGQEVYDYVNCVDTRDSNTERAGNIGRLERYYSPGKFTMNFSFGGIAMGGLAGTMIPQVSEGSATGGTTAAPATPASLQSQINQLIDYLNSLWDAIASIIAYLETVGAVNPLAGYIYIDADGDIILNPKSGRHTYGERIFANTRAKCPVGTNMYD